MKKKLLAICAIALLCSSRTYSQQMPYTLTTYNQTYVPLDTGATVIDPGLIWSGNTNNFVAPIGFAFKIDTTSCPYFLCEGGSDFVTDTNMNAGSGFILTDATLDDRGYGGSVSRSPVRYKISGPVGQRIFKAEVFNAGFDQEYIDSNTFNDSVNLQVWLYEDSNIVELRYGPSRVTGADYYSFGGNLAGYAKVINTNGYMYILSGDPASPTVQTIQVISDNFNSNPVPLSSFPPSGTVYRFTPIVPADTTTSVKDVFSVENVMVYPTACHSEINVSYKNNNTAAYNIVSVSGALMNIKGELNKGVNGIDIGSLPSGMYLLQLQNDTGRKVYKFVKL